MSKREKKPFKETKFGKLVLNNIVPIVRGTSKGIFMPAVNAGIEIFRNIKAKKNGLPLPHSTKSISWQLLAAAALILFVISKGWLTLEQIAQVAVFLGLG